MTKAKELFDETTISNMQKAMILFKEDTDIIKEELDYAEKCHNLEEELGCPLEVYTRATRSGIWFSTAGVMKHCYVDVIDASKIIFAMKGTNIWFELKKYQKSWWLRKDKSE